MSSRSKCSDELNTTNVWIEPSDDHQSILNSLKTDHNGGVATLKPGTHTLANVTVPAGVTVQSPSGSQDSPVTVEPASDDPCFIIDDGAAAVKHIHFEQHTVSSYSSDLVRCTTNNARTAEPVIANCSAQGDGSNRGSLFSFHDGSGGGISWQGAESLYAKGLKYGVRNYTDGGFVNAVRIVDLHMFDCEWCLKDEKAGNGGFIASNHYDIQVNGGGQAVGVIDVVDGGHTLDFQVFDPQGFSSDTMFDFGGPMSIRSTVGDVMRFGRTTDAMGTDLLDGSANILRYAFGGSLPYWLQPSGTGSESHNNRTLNIESGSSTGDRRIISPTTALQAGRDTSQQNPWMGFVLDPLDTTQVLHRAGMLGTTNTRYQFVADPTDSLGTGYSKCRTRTAVSRRGPTPTSESGEPSLPSASGTLTGTLPER